MSLNIRLEELIKYLNENPTSFAKGLKTASVETIRKLIKNDNANPTYKTLNEILEKYPKISAEWLVRGKGNIELRKEENTERNSIQLNSDTDTNLLRTQLNEFFDNHDILILENEELKQQLK